MPITKNTRHNLKRKRQRVLELGMILSLAFLVLAFKYSPTETSEEIIDLVFPFDDSFHVDPGTILQPKPKYSNFISLYTDTNIDDKVFCATELDINAVVDVPPTLIVDSLDKELHENFIGCFHELPTPIGGIVGIYKNVIYPSFAITAGIEGTVYTKAFINEEGDVYKVEIVKGIGGGCDEEAANAVSKTKFIPVKEKGIFIKSVITIPITFWLKEK